MAQNWQQTIQEAAQKAADALNDASELEVTTNFRTVNAAEGTPPAIVLVTKMKLDGDSVSDVPVEISPTGVQVASQLYDIHLANVEAGREYRASMFQALLSAVQSGIR